MTREHRPAGSSLAQTEGKAAPEGKPGKATLTQELLDAATRWDGMADNTKANL